MAMRASLTLMALLSAGVYAQEVAVTFAVEGSHRPGESGQVQVLSGIEDVFFGSLAMEGGKFRGAIPLEPGRYVARLALSGCTVHREGFSVTRGTTSVVLKRPDAGYMVTGRRLENGRPVEPGTRWRVTLSYKTAERSGSDWPEVVCGSDGRWWAALDGSLPDELRMSVRGLLPAISDGSDAWRRVRRGQTWDVGDLDDEREGETFLDIDLRSWVDRDDPSSFGALITYTAGDEHWEWTVRDPERPSRLRLPPGVEKPGQGYVQCKSRVDGLRARVPFDTRRSRLVSVPAPVSVVARVRVPSGLRAGGTARLMRGTRNAFRTTIPSSGWIRFPKISPGDYTLRIEHALGDATRRDIRIRPDAGDVDLEVVELPGWDYRVLVTPEGEAPPTRVVVVASEHRQKRYDALVSRLSDDRFLVLVPPAWRDEELTVEYVTGGRRLRVPVADLAAAGAADLRVTLPDLTLPKDIEAAVVADEAGGLWSYGNRASFNEPLVVPPGRWSLVVEFRHRRHGGQVRIPVGEVVVTGRNGRITLPPPSGFQDSVASAIKTLAR